MREPKRLPPPPLARFVPLAVHRTISCNGDSGLPVVTWYASLSKSVVHPILERGGQLAHGVTLAGHQRIDRNSRRRGEFPEADPAQRLSSDHFALRRR